jgi:hypothetical protein
MDKYTFAYTTKPLAEWDNTDVTKWLQHGCRLNGLDFSLWEQRMITGAELHKLNLSMLASELGIKDP